MFIPGKIRKTINAGYAYIELNLREGSNGLVIVSRGSARPDSLGKEDRLDTVLEGIAEAWHKDEKRKQGFLIIGLLIETESSTPNPCPLSNSHSLDLIRCIRAMHHGVVGTTFNAGLGFPIDPRTPLGALYGKIWFRFDPTLVDNVVADDSFSFCAFLDGVSHDPMLNTISYPHTDDRPFKDHLLDNRLVRVYPDPRVDPRKYRPIRFLAAGVHLVCVKLEVSGGVWDVIFGRQWYISRPPPISHFIIDEITDPNTSESNPLQTYIHTTTHNRVSNTKITATKPYFPLRSDLVIEVETNGIRHYASLSDVLSEDEFSDAFPSITRRVTFKRDPSFSSEGKWMEPLKNALRMGVGMGGGAERKFDVTVFKIRQFQFPSI